MNQLVQILNDRRTLVFLFITNIIVALGMMWATRNEFLADAYSYISLAEGILHGKYSCWWMLDGDYPDTFRSPGYPLFIAMMISLFGTWKVVPWVQLVLYILSIYITLETIKQYNKVVLVRSLFLILLIPMINVPYYIGQIYTEIVTLFLLSAAVYIGVVKWKSTMLRALLMGLIFGMIFQLKPIFLLFPILYSIVDILFFSGRKELKYHAALLFVFALTMIPYGLWNLRNHNVFKLTPLEGGGGYMHFAYWSGKMPGYTERFMWKNFAGDELVRFVMEEEIPLHVEAYENEWSMINARLHPLMTEHDSIMIRSGKMYRGNARTYNTEFTVLREQLLFEKAVKHMLNDPWYTLKFKLYSAVRLWVIGIQRSAFENAPILTRFRMLYATFITGVCLLSFLIIVPLAFKRRVLFLTGTWSLLLYLFYFGVIHIPFTIQARYTTPVRFVMLALLALAMAGLLMRNSDAQERRS